MLKSFPFFFFFSLLLPPEKHSEGSPWRCGRRWEAEKNEIRLRSSEISIWIFFCRAHDTINSPPYQPHKEISEGSYQGNSARIFIPRITLINARNVHQLSEIITMHNKANCTSSCFPRHSSHSSCFFVLMLIGKFLINVSLCSTAEIEFPMVHASCCLIKTLPGSVVFRAHWSAQSARLCASQFIDSQINLKFY